MRFTDILKGNFDMGLFDRFKKKENVENVGPTWVYTEEELDIIENHISQHFGSFDSVFHEIYSPDIHLDVVRINPTPELPHYTFITMGAGAYRMNLPEGVSLPSRAEYLITLPPDWDVENMDDNRNYWPLGFLKTIARIPIKFDTFLAYGHTASSDADNSSFADNTKLCSIALAYPEQFDVDCLTVNFPSGGGIVFYQMVPLYADELVFKQECEGGMKEFESYLGKVIANPLDINRPSCVPQK